MFGYLEGKILDIKPTRVILAVGGIGFVVNSTINCIQKLKTGENARFWTHTAVRENSIDLYGFDEEEDLRVFELLLTVSGIGPKSALLILGVAGLKAIEEAVGSGNASLLTKVSGVGKKTAERIVVELNGKLVARNENRLMASNDADVYDALHSLGYREKEIRETIRNIPNDILGANERIKYALKSLSR